MCYLTCVDVVQIILQFSACQLSFVRLAARDRMSVEHHCMSRRSHNILLCVLHFESYVSVAHYIEQDLARLRSKLQLRWLWTRKQLAYCESTCMNLSVSCPYEIIILEWTTTLYSSSGSLFVRMCIVQMSMSRRT